MPKFRSPSLLIISLLIISNMPPNKRPRTTLGQIYGHPQKEERDEALRRYNPAKSGITPLVPGPFESREEELDYARLHDYQHKRFHGIGQFSFHAIILLMRPI